MRSSAVSEDQSQNSQAGKYDSVTIKKNEKKSKIEITLDHFVKQFTNLCDLIIVQQKITNVDLSGVLFSKDTNHDSPYYLINYDSSGKTNLITSGSDNNKEKHLVIYKNKKKFTKFKTLILASKEIEKKINNDRIDIEFAYKKNYLYLFQVRRLYKKSFSQNDIFSLANFDGYLVNIKKKLKKLKQDNPVLCGKNTYFSNMADWNPAEMIGDKPRHLAVSLYKELITNDVWNDQRQQYGYQNVYPNVLMFTFAGSPYIDLRTDINSFIPNGFEKKEVEILIERYLKKIRQNPLLHDKIEFELVETCYAFNSKKRLKKLFKSILVNKYLKLLKKQTLDILKNDYIQKDLLKMRFFEKNLTNIKKKNISEIQKIYHITKIIKKYGTLPFAGLARCAFISQRILLDLKENKLISDKEFENFYSSIKSVTTIFNKRLHDVRKKNMTKKLFFNLYGHLRPSSYDITSLNYKEGFSSYFKNQLKSKKSYSNKTKFKNRSIINKLFKIELNITFDHFLKFAEESIYHRENAKLIFTKGINVIFENLIKLGKEVGIGRYNLSFVDFSKILNSYASLETIKLKKILEDDIKKNKREFKIMKKIKLPDIIINSNNIYEFYENKSKPNFITLKKEIGDVIELKNNNLNEIKNKILLIKNADPGYDYIFNYGIKGLITQYGGANSHMAIRCLEYNIPAAIGVGNLLFEKLKNSNKIIINCEKKIINFLG